MAGAEEMLYACTRQVETRERPLPLTMQYLAKQGPAWRVRGEFHQSQAYASRGLHIRKDRPTRVRCFPYGRPPSSAAAIGGRLRPVASARRSDKRRTLVAAR